MTTTDEESIPLKEASDRLLFHRPDLSRKRQERKQAQDVSKWIGGGAAAVDVLAGWLAARPERQVSDLTLALDKAIRTQRETGFRSAIEPTLTRIDREQLAFELAWRDLPAGAPRELLQVLALLQEAALPKVVAQAAVPARPVHVETALLSGFCNTDENGSLTMSARIVRFMAAHSGTATEVEERCLNLVLAIRDWIPQAWEDSDDLLRGPVEFAVQMVEQANQPDLLASLCHRMAERSRKRGRWEAADGWLQRAGRDPAASEAYAELLEAERAIVVLEAGHEEEGLQLLDEWLGRHDSRSTARVVSPQLVDRIRLFRALAMARAGRRGIAEAELRALFHFGSGLHPVDTDEGAIVGSEETPFEPARLVALHALGTLLLARDELSEGLACLTRAVQNWRDEIPGDDRTFSTLSVGLARALQRSDRGREAQAALEEARILAGGDMDRPTQASLPLVLHELGLLAAGREEWATATTLLDEAQMMAEALLPPRHPVRAQVHYSRGLMHLSAGDADRAERELVKALEIRATELGEDRPAVGLARAAVGWARAHQEASRKPMARDDLKAGIDLLARALGPDSEEALQVGALLDRL